MLRTVLVGLLSISAVACKSSDEPPKAQPGVAAGKVVEVSGTVTVRRADGARPLAKGDTVEGDDVIETGADGNVIVELAHNLARWELGASRKAKVRESQAWSLPKKTGEAATVEQTSAAAGRHAERSAAETSVSASAEEREAAPAAEPAPAAAAAAPAGAPAPAAAASGAAAPAPAAGASGAAAAPPPPPAPARRRAAESSERAKSAPVGLTAPLSADADAAIAARDPERAHDVIVKHERTIKACLTKDMPAVSLRIEIGADGKANVIVKGKTEVPAKVKSCVTNAVQKLTFPAQAATVTIEIAR